MIPDCSIIIVNWNVREYLRACLRSLPQQHPKYRIEVIVVDNGSTDGSQPMLEGEFPWVTTVALGENRGFAHANNVGIARATGRYIFILNPDTEIVGDALGGLISWMDMHPEQDMCVPQIVNADGSFQKGSVRRDPMLLTQLLILAKLQYIFAWLPQFRRYYAYDFDPSKEQEVEQAMGAALFIRREAIQRIGCFDEGYFLWFEEVDLCKRVRVAGKSIWYIPSAQVKHHGGKSFEQRMPLAKQRIYNASVSRYFAKYHSRFAGRAIRLIVPLNLLLVYFYQLLRPHGRK